MRSPRTLIPLAVSLVSGAAGYGLAWRMPSGVSFRPLAVVSRGSVLSRAPASLAPLVAKVVQNPPLTTVSGQGSREPWGRVLSLLAEERAQIPGSEEAAALYEELEKLKARPDQALDEIRARLAELSPGQASVRQFLLQWGARLGAPVEKRTELLRGELLRRFPGDPYSPAVALDSLYELTHDVAGVERELREALRLQPDAQARELLLSRFATMDPERAKELGAQFRFSSTAPEPE